MLKSNPSWKTVCLNLAVAYALALILTTFYAPPNDLAVLMFGPLVLIAVSGLFGLAVVSAIRLRKSLEERFRPRAVWLLSTWVTLILSLVDPFLPAPPPADRSQVPAMEVRRGPLDH